MTLLLILLTATVVVGIFFGLLAKMPVTQIAAQCAVMCVATLVFFTLVAML